MKPTADKSSKPEVRTPSAKPSRPDDRDANKVPESAENFEHILRRIVIEKAKAKRQP